MVLFKKEILHNNRVHILFCGFKIFSYKNIFSKFNKIYTRRFDGLNEKEMKYCLKHLFKLYTGKRLNLNNPQTFNEKLQWLKLYYHNPLMTKCADKVTVRDYIAEKIGEQYLVPCLGIYDNPNDIDFDKLPSKFVLKVNWGSGQNIIVRDKSKLDIESTKKMLAAWMCPTSNHYFNFFEWPYKNITPKIIIEQFMDFGEDLMDYKIMCYNGIPKNLFVCSERNTNLKVTFFDLNWKRLPFIRKYPASEKKISKPALLNKMLEFSEILAKPFPFVRVDFFYYNNQLYIGEMTFFPGAGHEVFDPYKWDKKLGDLLVLPNKYVN